MKASTSCLPQPDTARGGAPGSRMAAPLGLLFSASWTALVSALKGRQAMSPGQRPICVHLTCESACLNGTISCTPKAFRTIAQGCRVFSAATLGDWSACSQPPTPGVATRRQPRATMHNTFGVRTAAGQSFQMHRLTHMGQRPGRRTAHVHGQPFDVAQDMPVEGSVSRLSTVPEGEGNARVLSSSHARAS